MVLRMDEEHIELATVLRVCKGKVAVSGYRNSSWTALQGWEEARRTAENGAF